MIAFYYLFIMISGLLIFFLIMPFITVFLSLFIKEKIQLINKQSSAYRDIDFACIITAYKNAEISKPLIHSLINQKYQNLHIYLVADECDLRDWNLHHSKLSVLNPQPPLRLKAKSIIHATQQFVRPHEYIVIFDADNLAHPEFLNVIHQYVLNGYQAIQGQRTAKNLDTIYACADATGEFYKNYIDRYVPYMLGSSAVISGSGMAVETKLYKAYLESPEIEIGKNQWKKMLQEDKILQNNLLFKDKRIVYAWDAVVFDEKVVSGEQVETQRSRWLFSYFQNFRNSSRLFLSGIYGFSFNQFLFGLVTMSPPLFILLFSGVLFMMIGIFVEPLLSFALLGSIIIFVLTILWTLKLSAAPAKVWNALWVLPFFVLRQIKALFKMGNPNKNFKHSEHTRSFSIDEVMKDKE